MALDRRIQSHIETNMAGKSHEELLKRIQADAETHVSTSKMWLRLDFDYSPASLQLVDYAVDTHFPRDDANPTPGSFRSSTVWIFGCYVGETIRRALGGEWTEDESGVPYLHKVVGRDCSIFPFAWVHKRFDHGPDESVAYKFAGTLHALGRDAEIPAKIDLPVREVSEGAAPLEAVVPEEPSHSDFSDDDLINQSLALVFLTVAGADGNFDDKEVRTFLTMLLTLQSPSPLFRRVAEQTPEKFEEVAGQLQGKGGATRVALQLMLLRGALDKLYPNEAQAFCQSLMELATAIAKASGGGLFGLLSSISKAERKILDTLRQFLKL